MATINTITPDNLDIEFDIGNLTANKIRVKLDATLSRDATTGEIGVDVANIGIVSTDGGNLLSTGSDSGAFFDQAALQSAETVWSGSNTGFLNVTPAGQNGHAPMFSLDYNDPAFIEGVQDAIGVAVTDSASGISYDDANNMLAAVIASLAGGDGINITNGNLIAVTPDPTSALTVSVSPAGVKVTQTVSADAGNLAKLGSDGKVMVDPADIASLATIDVCDAFDNPIYKAFP